MPFTFGEASEKELVGVHPDLVAVARKALELTAVDFAIHDGMRTREEQAAHVAAGTSWRMDGRHLYGLAVDAVPVFLGRKRWEWPLCFKVAHAFRQAGQALHVPLIWGGVWDRILTEIGDDLEASQEMYVRRFRSLKRRSPNLDGPHFELPDDVYPSKVTA